MAKKDESKVVGMYAGVKEDAIVNKRTKKVDVAYLKFDKKGVTILGRFIGTNPVGSSMNEGEYNQYLFDTDTGVVKFACGGAFDADAGKLMEVGAVYGITYQGKEALKGGKRVNRFEVIRYFLDGEIDPDAEDSTTDIAKE